MDYRGVIDDLWGTLITPITAASTAVNHLNNTGLAPIPLSSDSSVLVRRASVAMSTAPAFQSFFSF